MPFIPTVKKFIQNNNPAGNKLYYNLLPALYIPQMKHAKQTFKIVTNKYVIAFSVFAVMMFFFDDNNLFVQLDRKHQLNELLTNKKYYEEKINTTKQELTHLQSNAAAIEKFVRENYMMKMDNEDVFIIDQAPETASDKKR